MQNAGSIGKLFVGVRRVGKLEYRGWQIAILLHFWREMIAVQSGSSFGSETATSGLPPQP